MLSHILVSLQILLSNNTPMSLPRTVSFYTLVIPCISVSLHLLLWHANWCEAPHSSVSLYIQLSHSVRIQVYHSVYWHVTPYSSVSLTQYSSVSDTNFLISRSQLQYVFQQPHVYYTYFICKYAFTYFGVVSGPTCTAVAQWLRCCVTNWKVAGVSEFFVDIKPFLSHYGPWDRLTFQLK